MSKDKKPSDDYTSILLIVILIVYFGMVIPGVRLLRSKYIEPAKSQRNASTFE